MNKTHTIKDFLPLITILLIIICFTYYQVTGNLDSDIDFAMRMFMAGFFTIFGLFKVLKWKGFVMAYREYDLIAMRSKAYAYLYPVIEIGLGFAYFYAWNLMPVAMITIILMLVGAAGVYKKLKKKEEIPCACLGVVFKIPMTKVTLFEDLLMAVMALLLIL